MKNKSEKNRRWTKMPVVLAFLCAAILLGAFQTSAQQRRITGTVSDARGPLAGVAVTVKGTTQGTTTDGAGKYAISASAESILEFSFIGYVGQEVTVGSRQVVDVTLEEDATDIDEVVVIGYGTVKKRDLTGSVSSIKEDVILAIPSGNVMQALQGRVTGLDMHENDKGELKLVMRGHRSINGTNDPLIIIDGVQGGSYSDINPADVASIDILKDASSTAIYGSQGANGVIIITTKAPDKGKMTVNYNAYAGWTMWADQNDRRVGESWIAPRRIAAQNAGQWQSAADDAALFGSNEAYQAFMNNDWTDYRELISRKPFMQNHTLSISGGTETVNARFTAGWEESQTKRKGGSSDKFNLRAEINSKVNSWLSAGVNMRLGHNYSKESPYQSDGGWQLGHPYDENGDLIIYPVGESGYVNPLLDAYYSNMKVKKEYSTRISATGYVDVKPVKGLNIRSQFNTNLSMTTTGSYTDKNSSGQIADNHESSSSMEIVPKRYIEWNNIVTYEKKLGDHSFGITALTAYTKSINEKLTGSGKDQLVNSNLWHALGGTKTQVVGSEYVQSQMFSYAARVNYSYKDRYLFTASWRRDGASRLSKGHKWASFPSAALAWRVSEENFMSGQTWLDNLKLRISYGVTGNSGIKEYGTQSGVVSSSTGLALQDKPLLHYDFANSIGNTETKWETSENFDVGVDFSIFNGRLDATIDFYNTNTKDLLLARKLPTSAGADGNFTIMQNIGRTNNKGVEVTLSGYPIRKKNFSWRATFTFSRNVEKIKELVDGNDIVLDGTDKETKTLMIGHPITSYNTYQYQGIWRTDEAAEAAKYFTTSAKTTSFKPGDYKILDRNGDFIIDMDHDYDYIGSSTPDWFAGFDHTFQYKNFDLNIYFYFRWGQYGSNPGANLDPATGGGYTLYDKWFWAAGTNENAKLPPLDAGKKHFDYQGYQSVWYCDRSYFKIKNVSLGYTLPKSVLSRAGIKNLRLYVSAANPLYFSKSSWLEGIDPEGSLRNYIFGVEFSF